MITKRIARILTVGVFSSLLIVLSTSAIELVDGKTYFLKPPRLTSSTTSQNGTYIWGATYYFTVEIPEGAGESLQRLEIILQAGAGRPVFTSSRTEAFEGTRQRPKDKIALKDVRIDPKTQAIAVTFDPPVNPGKTVTLRIYPVRNPSTGGTYLYGVTAFPSGKRPASQFLGFGRIRIYDREQD